MQPAVNFKTPATRRDAVTTVSLTEEGWTREELTQMTRTEMQELLEGEYGIAVPMSATKADLVALMVGEICEIPLSPEDMIRTAIQYRQWVRGVPPWRACLTAADKFYLKNLLHALDPVWMIS